MKSKEVYCKKYLPPKYLAQQFSLCVTLTPPPPPLLTVGKEQATVSHA